MTGNRIPLTVIGGFLGTGKTTLVNRILGKLSGMRAIVLMNDFGAVDVDAKLIAAAGGETISFTNGCVCCSINGDLTDALIRVIEAKPPPDWIIIEASGVSDPWKIAQVGLADPVLFLDGVVVLVDAESVRTHAADVLLSDTILRQFAGADLVVLNKTDLVDAAALKDTRTWLENRVTDAWIYESRDADVPLELLCSLRASRGKRVFRPAPPDRALTLQAAHDPVNHTHVFSTWSFETEHMFRMEKLRTLLNGMPAGIIRAKGIVHTDAAPMQASIFQFTGRSPELKLSGPWTESHSRIVFIGLPEVSFEAIETRLLDALLQEPVPGN